MGHKKGETNIDGRDSNEGLGRRLCQRDLQRRRPHVPTGRFQLAQAIKEKSRKNIWCYTGYTFERLLDNPKQAELLKYIDVLVDGKFKQALRDESLLFRGSSNQRLIDVKASLKANKTVLLELNYDL